MSNVLVIDDQKWVVDLCKDELAGEMCKVSATDNVESVRENIFSFKPDVVLLNLYLKHGCIVWDVLRDIKMQSPDLPVLIVAAYDDYLFDSRLLQTDGYVIKNHYVCGELKQKIFSLINRKSAVNESE